MKILFIGDIFASQGRKAIKNELKNIVKNNNIDFVIANAENCTHGRSISLKHYKQLIESGIDVITMGNHTWKLKEVVDVLEMSNVIRPLNIKKSFKYYPNGQGTSVFLIKAKKIRITNLIGLTLNFNDNQTNPFLCLENVVANDDSDIHIVDFHTEATSEKNALLKSFNGRVSAILGTHTHVQTADNKIFNNTAFISDVGMTGPSEGIIGAKPDTIIDMFYGKRENFILEPSKSKYQFSAIIIEFDDKKNIPISTQRILKYE